MGKSIIKLMCFMVFFLFASTLFAIDVPLEYVKYPAKTDKYFPTGMARLKYTINPPPGDWKLPDFVSTIPIYALVKLGEEEKLLIMDRQKTEDEYYNRIFFDDNANKDLSDDPVIDGETVSVPGRYQDIVKFPVVDTEIKVEGKSLPYSFHPNFFGTLRAIDGGKISEELLNKMIYLYLQVNCMYKGKFQVDGQVYYIHLADANCNGLIHDKFALRKLDGPFIGRMPIPNTGDYAFISQDEEIDMYSRQICGDWLLIKNRLFEVSINQKKQKLTLIPVTKNLVPLTLSMKPDHISLYTDGGEHFLMTCKPDKTIDIPKGKYRLFNYKVLKRDEQGDLWSLSARATIECPWIAVDEGKDNVLKFGEPYVISAEVPGKRLVNVRDSTTRKNIASISFVIRGQYDEDISDISHIKGTKTKIPLSEKKELTHRPKEPTYKILLVDGTAAAQGSFEYG